MDNEEIVQEETLETPEETTEESAQETKVEQDERDKKIAELEEKNRKLFERAKKAEGKKTEQPEISQSDLYALIKANVPEEDVSEVSDYAKLKKISIQEALKSSVVRTILAERAEERTTAQATATGAQRRASSEVSDETLLINASKGQVPEDDASIAKLAQARLAARLKK